MGDFPLSNSRAMGVLNAANVWLYVPRKHSIACRNSGRGHGMPKLTTDAWLCAASSAAYVEKSATQGLSVFALRWAVCRWQCCLLKTAPDVANACPLAPPAPSKWCPRSFDRGAVMILLRLLFGCANVLFNFWQAVSNTLVAVNAGLAFSECLLVCG